MEINADFDQRIVIHTSTLPWLDSPMKGVRRRMLDRVGDEVARATSIVQYEPGSHFSPHVHHGGEEFIVLEGVFQDEHGDYPAGTYVRNPPQSKHTPASDEGCVIFVKLWQFEMNDRTTVRIDINAVAPDPELSQPGVNILPLFKNHEETVQAQIWSPGEEIYLHAPGGAELYVLDGDLRENTDPLSAGSWLRIPANSAINACAGEQGARVWIKFGHLRHVRTAVV